MKSLILSLILATVVLSGCFFILEEQQNITENETEPPPPPPPPTPSFTVTSPVNGETVFISGETGDVTLTISTQNLILKDAGGANTVGQGHFSLTVDGAPGGTFATKIYVVSGLELGDHTIGIELLNNDGTSYSPQIYQEVLFTVEQEEPDVYVPKTHTVVINDFDYSPPSLTVNVTDSITFVNQGSFPRSATCFIDGKQKFDTGVIGPEESATVTATEVMQCEYYSTTHMAMKGTLVVKDHGMASVEEDEEETEDLPDWALQWQAETGKLVQASADCSPEEVTATYVLNFFGMEQTSTSTYGIQGMEGDKCVFYLRTESIEVSYPEGTDQETIDEQRATYDQLEGLEGTCKFETSDLTAMLERWEQGSLSSSDWDVAECEGEYFNPQLN